MATAKKRKSSGTKRTVVLTGGVIALIAALLQGTGFGFGNGLGFGDGDKNSTAVMNQDKVEVEDNEMDTEKEEVQTEQKENAEEQKQDEVEQKTIVAITVVENDYFYNNERIALDDFIAVVQGIGETVVVEIKDDNASLRAYQSLLDKLKEVEFAYIETVQEEIE